MCFEIETFRQIWFAFVYKWRADDDDDARLQVWRWSLTSWISVVSCHISAAFTAVRSLQKWGRRQYASCCLKLGVRTCTVLVMIMLILRTLSVVLSSGQSHSINQSINRFIYMVAWKLGWNKCAYRTITVIHFENSRHSSDERSTAHAAADPQTWRQDFLGRGSEKLEQSTRLTAAAWHWIWTL